MRNYSKFRKQCDSSKQSYPRVGISKHYHTDRRSKSGDRIYLRFTVNYTDEHGLPCVKTFNVGREGHYSKRDEKDAENRAIAFREAWEATMLIQEAKR